MAEEIIHFTLQKPPEFLFYATDEYSIDKVMRKGLNKRITAFMYESEYEAKKKVPRNRQPFLVAILARLMADDGYKFSHAESGEWLTDEVPMRYIRLQ